MKDNYSSLICVNNYPTRCNNIQFIYTCNCSTCFVWYFHLSSGVHITVSTVPGIIETVNATCERGWTVTAIPVQPRSQQLAVTVSIIPGTVDTVIRAPDYGWRYHPKRVE